MAPQEASPSNNSSIGDPSMTTDNLRYMWSSKPLCPLYDGSTPTKASKSTRQQKEPHSASTGNRYAASSSKTPSQQPHERRESTSSRHRRTRSSNYNRPNLSTRQEAHGTSRPRASSQYDWAYPPPQYPFTPTAPSSVPSPVNPTPVTSPTTSNISPNPPPLASIYNLPPSAFYYYPPHIFAPPPTSSGYSQPMGNYTIAIRFHHFPYCEYDNSNEEAAPPKKKRMEKVAALWNRLRGKKN